MKKSTILILVAIFAVSVLVVGIYGLKAVPFSQIVYCEQITPVSFTTTSGKDYEILSDENGYYVFIYYEENLSAMISYKLTPADCTYKNVKIQLVSSNKNVTVSDMGEVTFAAKESVHLRYSATDSATAATMDFFIYFIS